ncbi:hypothetical protein ABZ566_36395, partial [Streptomyces hygroscopicus]|uniref:hypothetical protein n=1 Tax=Streptomyces hygroscopicus TaxID=1912 RepID=UPI0033C8DD18
MRDGRNPAILSEPGTLSGPATLLRPAALGGPATIDASDALGGRVMGRQEGGDGRGPSSRRVGVNPVDDFAVEFG